MVRRSVLVAGGGFFSPPLPSPLGKLRPLLLLFSIYSCLWYSRVWPEIFCFPMADGGDVRRFLHLGSAAAKVVPQRGGRGEVKAA